MSKQQLKAAGFVDAEDRAVIKPRIIVSISALEKQGKTHFAFTAPPPWAYFSTDIGEEGVIGKFDTSKMKILDIARVEADTTETEADKEFEKFVKGYRAALRSNYPRTLIVDTATEIWELLRMARFGKLLQVMPYQYGPVNAEYRRLIREAYDYDKNVILLHRMKAKYVNDKRTNEYERTGFNDTGFLVQLNAELFRDEDGFNIWIKDSRHDPDLADTVLTGPMCNFSTLAMMVMPDADPKNWE